MVSYLSNYRDNALQLHNAMTFMATGVSDRVFQFLNTLGLSSSRDTAIRSLNHLKTVREDSLQSLMSQSYSISPIICIDNFDLLQRVHNTRVEKVSHLFHGTWGYVQFLPKYLAHSMSQDSAISHLQKYHQTLASARNTPVQFENFRDNASDMMHWEAVMKSQLSKVMYKYILEPGTTHSPGIATCPPQVDPIPWDHRDLFLMSLMDAPDNSAEGVAQVFEEMASQFGMTLEEMSKSIQVVQGDLGTCQNIESLRKKRCPAGTDVGGLSSILTIPGVSHIMWNLAQAILSHHWGDPRNSKDSGAWKAWQSLGGLQGSQSKLPSSMDFGTVMMAIHKIHSATLVSFLK